MFQFHLKNAFRTPAAPSDDGEDLHFRGVNNDEVEVFLTRDEARPCDVVRIDIQDAATVMPDPDNPPKRTARFHVAAVVRHNRPCLKVTVVKNGTDVTRYVTGQWVALRKASRADRV